jgi:hypothetical protein
MCHSESELLNIFTAKCASGIRDIVIRYSFSLGATVDFILQAFEYCARKTNQSVEEWSRRPWLFERESQHETFLASITLCNPMVAQRILFEMVCGDFVWFFFCLFFCFCFFFFLTVALNILLTE